MSKPFTSQLLLHLQGEVTTLCLCWVITKRNGAQIFGTDHDLDVVITIGTYAGTYKAGANISGTDVSSSADMSVDNTEVNGSFSDKIYIPDLTVEDVRAKLYNNAPVTLFFTNWQAPNDGQGYVRSGYLGDLTWDSNNTYKTEIRGLTQLLSQNIVKSYSIPCDVVHFGDSRCKVDVDAISFTGTVTAVVSRKQFTVSGDTVSPGSELYTGIVVGLTGANAGFQRQVKIGDYLGTHGQLFFYEEWPAAIVNGDTFKVSPGCDRSLTMCKVYGSVPNYRGYGLLVPGAMAILRGPVGATSLGGG